MVLPAGGGLGVSTMPVLEGVVEGAGSEPIGTESVVGICEAVGVTFLELPLMSFSGWGMSGCPGVETGAGGGM